MAKSSVPASTDPTVASGQSDTHIPAKPSVSGQSPSASSSEEAEAQDQSAPQTTPETQIPDQTAPCAAIESLTSGLPQGDQFKGISGYLRHLLKNHPGFVWLPFLYALALSIGVYYEAIYYAKFHIDIIWYLSPEDFLFRWLHHKHVIYAAIGVILTMTAFFYGNQVGRRLAKGFSGSVHLSIVIPLFVFAVGSYFIIDVYELKFGQVFDKRLRWVVFSAIMNMGFVTSAAIIIGLFVDDLFILIKNHAHNHPRLTNFLDTAPKLLGFTKERRRDVCWGGIYLMAVLFVIWVLAGQLAVIANSEKKQMFNEKARNEYEVFIKSDSGWVTPAFTLRLIGATNNYKFFCRQILSRDSVLDTLWQPMVLPSIHIAYMEKKAFINSNRK